VEAKREEPVPDLLLGASGKKNMRLACEEAGLPTVSYLKPDLPVGNAIGGNKDKRGTPCGLSDYCFGRSRGGQSRSTG